MKIGLLSDTHGELDNRVLHYFKEVDQIWHAGDIGSIKVLTDLIKFKKTVSVYGNIDNTDIRKESHEYVFKQIEGLKFLMIHIGGKPGRYNKKAYYLIKKYKPNIFICGHSHMLFVQKDKTQNLLCLNPGACGYKGFHKVRTILRFDVVLDQIKNLEVIELGKRSKLVVD